MVNIITNIMAWFVKNVAHVAGVVDAVLKILAGIASVTPTDKDDKIVAWLEKHKISEWLYKIADFFGKLGK